MGFFDFFKKKKKSEVENISDFEKDLIQTVAISIFNMKITKQPILRHFFNDQGILEGTIISHLSDPNCNAIKKSNKDLYLQVLVYHAFGTGIYVTYYQDKVNRSVDKFTNEDAINISRDFRKTDPYELAIKTMGLPLNSPNKACLDRICNLAIQSAQQFVGDDLLKEDYLRSLMKIMYNAGITVAMR